MLGVCDVSLASPGVCLVSAVLWRDDGIGIEA